MLTFKQFISTQPAVLNMESKVPSARSKNNLALRVISALREQQKNDNLKN